MAIDEQLPQKRHRSIVSFMKAIRASLLWIVCAAALWSAALVIFGGFKFRLLGVAVEGVFEFLRAILILPARVLRGKP